MIEVLGLQTDGNEQPQFFMLTFRYPNMGEGYSRTNTFGTEVFLRGFLRDHGMAGLDIDALFKNAH